MRVALTSWRTLQPCNSLLRRHHWRLNGSQLALQRVYASTSSAASRERRQLWLLVIPVTTFCLGTWQVFRLQWKLGLIDDLGRRTRKSPIEIPANIQEQLEELEYRRVRLCGHFDHSKELYMWPRSRVVENPQQRGSEPGAFVVTSFYCRELGDYILVNRGWVPRRRMNPETRPQGQVEGDVSLTAVVRTQEKRAPFGPHNDPAGNRWSFRDVAAMARQGDTRPVFLDADATSTVAGGPIGGQTRVTLRNDHLQYLLTWYALSLITFYMFWQLMKKSKKWR